jgi:ribosome-binding factor A
MKDRSSHKAPPRRSGANKNPGASAPGQRQLRVAERIRHILAQIMRDGRLHDPALGNSSLITVTAVEIGPDLQHATAFVMPLGGKNVEETVAALNKAAGFFRAELAPELDLRYTPKVSFRPDRTFDEAEHIDKLLRQDRVKKDLEKDEDDE